MPMWTKEEGERVMAEALKRSATDPVFRKKLLIDTNGAVESIAGKPTPSNFKIRLLERSGYDITLVLPDPVSADNELSDAELEQVAGGQRGSGDKCSGSCVTTG